jgi:hypothetical protein
LQRQNVIIKEAAKFALEGIAASKCTLQFTNVSLAMLDAVWRLTAALV